MSPHCPVLLGQNLLAGQPPRNYASCVSVRAVPQRVAAARARRTGSPPASGPKQHSRAGGQGPGPTARHGPGTDPAAKVARAGRRAVPQQAAAARALRTGGPPASGPVSRVQY